MYAVATHEMAESMKLGFLDPIPWVFLCLALLAWAVTFTGLLRSIARSWRRLPLFHSADV
jgi:hypothetical protein